MLTRSFLKGMGITDEQISAIIEAHTESTDALKAQRDEYKAQAEKLPSVQAELDKLKKDGGDWQSKYDKEHKDFEAYKTEQAEKSAKQAKETAFGKLLKELGIDEKRHAGIIKLTDLNKVEVDENGGLKDVENLKKGIQTEWSDFIPDVKKEGANTQNPPSTNNNNVDLGSLSMADYIKARSGK